MQRFWLLAIISSISMSVSVAVNAAAPKIEQECRVCHGATGISSMSIVPNLACQQERYLINAMMAYREGRRVDASMSAAMGSMLDADIKELAAYYSHLGCR